MTVDPKILTVPARRIQTVMSFGVVLFSAATAALAIGAITAPTGTGESLATMGGFSTGPMEGWQNGALVGIAAIHLAIWIALFLTARRMFSTLADGDAEIAGAAARTLSNWLWAMLAWGLISQVLVGLVATWGFPEGERSVGLGIGTTEISLALSALIAGLMARAFAFGAELWRDHREVI
ncbi:MAG: hypothetical protein AAGD34_13780 [Pseudomonadota bacterium]